MRRWTDRCVDLLQRLHDGEPIERVPAAAATKNGGGAPLDLSTLRGRLDLSRLAISGPGSLGGGAGRRAAGGRRKAESRVGLTDANPRSNPRFATPDQTFLFGSIEPFCLARNRPLVRRCNGSGSIGGST